MPPLIALIMAVTACGNAAETRERTEGPPPGMPTGEVTGIVDGDTIEVGLESGSSTVRLLGINAPDEGECFFAEATDYLIESLEGSTITLSQQGKDQFGRDLAWVWHGDEMVNLRMVRQGLAIATTPDDAGLPGADLLISEQFAYETGTGLWGERVCGSSANRPDIDLDTSGSNPPGADGDELGNEFIVVSNPSDQRVELTGWTLRDESSTHRYRFQEGVFLEPGGTLRITSDNARWEPGDRPVWNNEGDMALLLDENGRVTARRRYP